LQIVTATLGIVLVPVLRTTTTMRECWARRWELGKLAAARTGKLPLGSFASWDWPPPHALSSAPAAIASATAQAILRLLLLKARRTYHL
jgi:hypothetical protein